MKDEIFYFIPELLSFLIILVCITALLLSTKFFGRYGLYAYSIDCNHNFKYSSFKTYTIFINFKLYHLRSSIVFDNICRRQYINNILTEQYGEKPEKNSLKLDFSDICFFVIVMQIAFCHPTFINSERVNLHSELEKIFSPVFYLFI